MSLSDDVDEDAKVLAMNGTAQRRAEPALREKTSLVGGETTPARDAARKGARAQGARESKSGLSREEAVIEADRVEFVARRLNFASMLIDTIKTNALIEEDLFQKLIRAAIEQYGVKQHDLAGELKTASSNITRWKDGVSAPAVRNRPFDLWGLHCLIMSEEGRAPAPFPTPPRMPKASEAARAEVLAAALTAEEHFPLESAATERKAPAARKSKSKG